MAAIFALGGAAPLPAHTFPGITADALFVGDTLVLTLDLHRLDVIAILDHETISGRQTLTRAEFEAALPEVRGYLARTVLVSVDGRPLAGRCLGVSADLAGLAAAGEVPVRLPFILVWAPPREVHQVDIAFTLLPKQLAGGALLATLHRGMTVHSRMVEIGSTVSFTVQAESELLADPQGSDAAGAAPGAAATAAATADTATLPAWRLLAMGFRHIIPEGLDHILFVCCLFLLAPRVKPLLMQVTAFTVAHSVTLGLAMAGVVLLPSRLVETLIALSIVVMAVENLVMGEVKPWRWALVFAFGLVHGLGFAGSFSALRLAEGDFVRRHLAEGDFVRSLVLLNLGIELGQLAVLAAVALLTCLAWRFPWYRARVAMPASALIALLAAWWTVQRGFAP